MAKEHKYRVSVYLGKENYELLCKMANLMNMPLSTLTRVMIDTGIMLSQIMPKEGANNGEQ